MKFESKKDRWLAILIIFILAILPVTTAYDILQGNLTRADVFISVAITFIMPAFIGWLWFQTHYTILEDTLVVVSGPLRKKIPLNEITFVKPSKNPISSPALSFDRIMISYGNHRTVYISPKERALFISELTKKCPNAQIEDGNVL